MDAISSGDAKRQLVPLDLFCNEIMDKATYVRMQQCIEAFRLVVRVLQQSERERDSVVAKIILSIAQGYRSVEDGKRELAKALLNG